MWSSMTNKGDQREEAVNHESDAHKGGVRKVRVSSSSWTTSGGMIKKLYSN